MGEEEARGEARSFLDDDDFTDEEMNRVIAELEASKERPSTDVPDYDRWRRSEWREKKVRLRPAPKDKEIIGKYFELNPVSKTQKELVEEVAREVGTSRERAETVIRKGKLRELGKEQKREITERVYGDKLELVREIIEDGLFGLRDWVKLRRSQGIDGYEEAKAHLSIVNNLNNLLRLEMGKSTANLEVVQTIHRDVSVILNDLSGVDPFRTYPVIKGGVSEEEGEIVEVEVDDVK